MRKTTCSIIAITAALSFSAAACGSDDAPVDNVDNSVVDDSNVVVDTLIDGTDDVVDTVVDGTDTVVDTVMDDVTTTEG